MNQLIQNLLGFALLLVALAIIAAPFYLIIQYPSSGEWLASVANRAIPWLVIFFLALVFSDGIKQLFYSIGRTFDRIKKLQAGSAAAELEPHQKSPELVGAQHTPLFDAPTSNRFFLLYIFNQIFGSQYEFLQTLKSASTKIEDAVPYYEKFKERLDIEADISFEAWLNFLKNNGLIRQPDGENKLEITQPGIVFVDATAQISPPPQFRY